ncbi:MAG: DUF262 domain-containing protein [Symploca sp. SIO2B6]|nr:DUF262 domain-containing protein [Symploca sp. SIO2B6]
MSLRPDNLTLDKLLQGRLFRIPDYQRTYSWETKQRIDLFGDIEKLASKENSERHHFMSTVVCLQTKEKKEVGADEFGIFYIVDGQQRLTTLIILLKALVKVLRNGSDIEQKESGKLQELLVKENGRLILLQTNHDSKRLFRNYLEQGEIPQDIKVETLAERNMIKAFKECEDFVQNFPRDHLLLVKLVKNKLDFIFYVLEDEGAVNTTFEVLNSRGLEVDWLDKCKSIMMGIAFEKLESSTGRECIKELHEYWSKIYRTIGLNKIQGQEILRFAATLENSDERRSKISSAENAMEFFRKKCEGNPQHVIEVSSKFLDVAEKLEEFVTDPRLKAVNKISHARLLAVAIKLNKTLSRSDKKYILKEWEKVTFRIFGLSRKDSRTKIGDYVRLARSVFKNTDVSTSEEIVKKVTILGEDFPVSKVADELRETNCYEGWEDELVYFLYRYEEHLTHECGGSISEEVWKQVWTSSPAKTIEHIHPQNINKNWRGKIGTKTDYVKRQVQRLGNLIILPPEVNSKASNKSFEDKKEIYRKHRHLKLVDEVIEKEEWNMEALKEREDRLIAWAKEEWK